MIPTGVDFVGRIPHTEGMTTHPNCPDCGSQAWMAVGSLGRFVLCRLCNARWAIDVLQRFR